MHRVTSMRNIKERLLYLFLWLSAFSTQLHASFPLPVQASFQAEAASIASHTSGTALLWYKPIGMNVALLLGFHVGQGDRYPFNETLVMIPETQAICSVSASTGGAIYVAWQEQQQLVVANFRLDGHRYWEDRVDIGSGPLENCKISTGAGDALLIYANRFIYRKRANQLRGEVQFVNQYLEGAPQPYISATGGYAFLNTSTDNPADFSLCIEAPELSASICLADQTASEPFTSVLPLHSDLELFLGIQSAYRVSMNGVHASRDYLVILNNFKGNNRVQAHLDRNYPHTGKLTLVGDEVQTYGQKLSYARKTLSRRLSIVGTSPLEVSVMKNVQWGGLSIKKNLEQKYRFNNSLSALPDSLRAARISHVPESCHQVDRNHSSSFLFTTSSGEVGHLAIQSEGQLVNHDPVQLDDWHLTAQETTSIITGPRFSNLLVLGKEGTSWQLSALGLDQFGLSTNTASLRPNLGTNDLSHGIEILLDSLMDIDRPGRWALVVPGYDNSVLSLTNEPDGSSPRCDKVLDYNNLHDPMAIGISPIPGSTAVGVTNNDLVHCLKVEDTDVYLMHFSEAVKEWVFTGHVLRVIPRPRYDYLPYYWLPEACPVVVKALSSPFNSDKRYNGPVVNLDVVGWPHIVINAENLPQSSDPVNFTAPTSASPTSLFRGTAETIAITTIVATVIVASML